MKNKKGKNKISIDEYNAMHVENLIRYELGHPIRSAYTRDQNYQLFFKYIYENK